MLLSNQPAVAFDTGPMSRLNRPGTRYTSYPTPDRFSDAFGYRDYLHAVAGLRTRGGARPLSLYLHIPFCGTRNRERAATYLGYLKREIQMLGRLFAGMNEVAQLHLGGGPSACLTDAQMDDLMAHLRRCFPFAPGAADECSIEVDPRSVSPARVCTLRRQGFSRIVLGVHDFDAEVQKAVSRIQPESETRAIVDAAHGAGFRSVGIDLVYGLPRQSFDTMQATLDKVIAQNPDRISLYRYTDLPQLSRSRRRIRAADMPDAAAMLRILRSCAERLTGAGYLYIGTDDFARPGDDLAQARRQGQLHRNLQGCSTHADTNLVSCGVSAISAVGATYSQNAKDLASYYDAIDCNELPVARGVRLSMDDALRRTVIQKLMCDFEVDIPAIEQAFPIVFDSYFACELARLADLERDGLLVVGPASIAVTEKGRLLVRTACMVFDRYLAARDGQPRRSPGP